MGKIWDIFGVGTSAVDDLFVVDQFPQPDEKIPVRSFHRHAGGQTATALVAAARHGARTAFFTRLGEDELSRFTIAELQKEQVDCSFITISPDSQPFYAIVIIDESSASRTILFRSDGVLEPDMNRFNPDWIAQSRVLFIDNNIPYSILRAAQLAREAGVPVIADIESTTIPTLPALLPLIDHLIVSRSFAARLSGKNELENMMAALAPSTRLCTAITAGESGCWYQARGKPICHMPAYSVKVVDTLGCGDVFHGTYAAAIARGESIDRAIIIATASAGIKAAQPGGRTGVPSLADVEQFIASHCV